jgi:hypothetical protein
MNNMNQQDGLWEIKPPFDFSPNIGEIIPLIRKSTIEFHNIYGIVADVVRCSGLFMTIKILRSLKIFTLHRLSKNADFFRRILEDKGN